MIGSWKMLLVLLAALSLSAAACSDDDGDDGSPETEDTIAGDDVEGDVVDAGGDEEVATADCPHEGDTVFMFSPYEANQPAGVNWRAGVEHAVGDINAAGGILGCTIEVEYQDTQADPDVSKQVVAEGAEKDPYVFLGTVFSSSTIVNMIEAQRAEIPQFVGAEAPNITNREENGDNDYIFRSSFGSDKAAPKLVGFMQEEGVQMVDIIFKNDEFGAGGAEATQAAMEDAGMEIGEVILVQPDQIDLSGEVSTLAGTDADAVFVFMTELETAAFLDEVQSQAFEKPLYGGDVLTSAAVIDLVEPGAADGTKSHSGLNASAAVFDDWLTSHEAFHPGISGVDHNNIKGYMAVHVVKEITERIGSFDRVALAQQVKCETITTADEPGVLLDVSYDADGDLDRESFIVEVVEGVGQIASIAPPLGNLADRGC